MSNETATSAVSDMAAAPASASPAVQRRRQARDGARPLSEKRALLHAQRLRTGTLRYVALPAATGDGALLLRSEDGAVTFVLRSTSSGMVVERTQRRPLGSCLVQTLLFANGLEFTRWCEADCVRFDEPVLYGRLRREGDACLGDKR